jgi:hypothetical protein
MILKLHIFSAVTHSRSLVRCGYGMTGGYLNDVVLHSLKNNHQERVTGIRQLSKDIAVAFGAVM